MTSEEIKRIFGSPLFTAYELPEVEKAGQDAAYWVPLLALYTGARVSELAQLRVMDLVHCDSKHGPATVPALDITDEPEDDETGALETSAKTERSVRRVPVHRELIRLGFLDYVAAMKDAGSVQMFPTITRREGARAGAHLSTWFGGYRKRQGVDGNRRGFHAARHTVRTALADTGATDAQAFAIGGWAGARGPGNEVYLHTGSMSIASLREVLDRLTYPGLDLPRVFTAPVCKPGAR